MTKPRTKMPIESFGPELFNALIEGSKRKVELNTDYKTAVKLRMRIHQLRARMREESHPLYPIAAKAHLTISWPDSIETLTSYKKIHHPKNPKSPVTLTISPHDSEYGDIFKDAGIDVLPIDHNLFTDTVSPNGDTDSPPTLEDLLKDFK